MSKEDTITINALTLEEGNLRKLAKAWNMGLVENQAVRDLVRDGAHLVLSSSAFEPDALNSTFPNGLNFNFTRDDFKYMSSLLADPRLDAPKTT